ncbi:MAG: hypothetical protein ABIQ52_00245 [Vicinamibacterales bacterium]
MIFNDAVARSLFDVTGRRIPGPGIGAPVNDASSRYSLAQPEIDYNAIHGRITEHLGSTGLSATEFEDRAEALLDGLRRSEETAPLANGVRLPFMLAVDRTADLGGALDETYLPALSRAWNARFPKYDFKNELHGRLAGKVSIAEGAGYERLVNATAEGTLVGFYFPLALSGFSVPAARRQMADLPVNFALSGGHEACAAMIGCPDLVMQSDGYPPQLELAGVQGAAATYGYHFAPYGCNLTFNGRHHNGQSSDYVSPGLTVLAPSGKKK